MEKKPKPGVRVNLKTKQEIEPLKANKRINAYLAGGSPPVSISHGIVSGLLIVIWFVLWWQQSHSSNALALHTCASGSFLNEKMAEMRDLEFCPSFNFVLIVVPGPLHVHGWEGLCASCGGLFWREEYRVSDL